jgi:hypothetical protein
MYGYDRISQIIEDPNLRASDADREATADRLREHHIDGRLDQDEFQARLDRCFAAKTVGELAELTRDLPADPARRGSGTTTSFGLLGGLRMIPIVPIILAIVAMHLVVGGQRPVDPNPAVLPGPPHGLPQRIPRLNRSPLSRAVAARRAGRGGLVAVTGTRAAGPEPRPVEHDARLQRHRRPPAPGRDRVVAA